MKAHASSYFSLCLMAILSFVSMYILMYMMVDSYANVFPNLNQFYMAGMMTAPMLIIELLLMRDMYPKKIANIFLLSIGFLSLIFFIFFIREQTGISDKEFLKSMIPHHAGALLMCQKASLQDAEIKELCKKIIVSQQSEIEWMKIKLKSLEAK